MQRLQPGSASGTQARESWHRHKLKTYLRVRTSLESFGTSLGQFAQSRLADVFASDTMLPDISGEPFLDRVFLHDSDVLTKEGRAPAHQFFRTKAFDVYENEGTVYVATRRSLSTWDSSASKWTSRLMRRHVLPGLASRTCFPPGPSHVCPQDVRCGFGTHCFGSW